MSLANSRKKKIIIGIIVAMVAIGTALTFDYTSGKKEEYQNPAILDVSDRNISIDGANPANTRDTAGKTSQNTSWQEMPWGNAVATSTSGVDNASGAINSQNNLTQPGTTALGVDTTDQIGQNFFSQYMNLSESGAVNNADATTTAIELARKLLPENQVAINYGQYATSSIAVENNETTAQIQAYGNNLGTIMLQNSPVGLQNELTILAQADQQNDPSVLDEMDTNINAYQNILNNYATMDVPKSALILHMQLLDTISQLTAADTAMKVFFTDPITAASGFGLYNSASANLKNIIILYSKYFAEKHITFTASSGGYSFTHIAQ
jgi:hypothetical protein